jgi:maltose O-acetyltransferase
MTATEREKMIAGKLYNPLDPDLVATRECQGFYAANSMTLASRSKNERRCILRDLFGAGGDTVWM